jgi:PTS system nitrogen regulatory IIA component
MNAFARILFPENIFLNLEATDKSQALSHIASLLQRQHQIDGALITRQLHAREARGTTGLGRGVAIPHARIATLDHPMAAFARLRTPIPFDAPDGLPVSELFLLLFPARTTDGHVQMLADVAGLLCDEDFRMCLNAAGDIATIRQCFMKRVARQIRSMNKNARR